MTMCVCGGGGRLAVVAIMNSGRSKMDRAMHLMRCLSFISGQVGSVLEVQAHSWSSEWGS